jgi:hypothetical protein
MRASRSAWVMTLDITDFSGTARAEDPLSQFACRLAFALFVGLLLACSANAQGVDEAIQKVAIVSLIGDVMTVDTYRPRIGTGIDSNHQDVIPIQTPVFDHTALLAAGDALTKLNPAARVVSLAVPAPGSESDPARLMVDGKVAAASAFIASLQEQGFTHLLTIAKHRAPARFHFVGTTVGSGNLQGIGFYIDNDYRTSRGDTGETGKGFMAPYVYIKLTLVDLGSLQLRGEETITASVARSAARNKDGFSPWGAMTPEQKVGMLKSLIKRHVSEGVPLLFRPK